MALPSHRRSDGLPPARDDAFRIFRETRQLRDAAIPVKLGVLLVPDFPVLDMSMGLQVGRVIDVGGNIRNPRLPDGIRSGTIAFQVDWSIALARPAARSGSRIVAGTVRWIRRGP